MPALFHAWPMIDVTADWGPCGEFLKAADVVNVIMRDDPVIDLPDARRVDNLHQTVAIALPRISGVFQQCFSRERNVQHRVTAVHIGYMHIERLLPSFLLFL